jgi:hypothetical protein
MCGGSKSTAPPPPSPPTTFGYGVADGSNAARKQQQLQASTMEQPTNPTALTATDAMTAAGTSTLGGQ